MKKIVLSICLIIGATAIAQNTVPTLEVEGNVKVDSCVIVRDSIIVSKNARIKGDEKVEGSLFIGQDIIGNNDLEINRDGSVKRNLQVGKNLTVDKKIVAPNLQSVDELGNKDIIVKGNNGVLKTLGIGPLVDAIYSKQCAQDINGNYLPPVWNNKPEVLYTGDQCPASVGIGTQNPDAKLDVRGTGYFLHQIGTGEIADDFTQLQVSTTKKQAIVVTNQDDNADVFRVLSNGEVWATEINVDYKEDFPDYVFDENYYLMPLDQLESYIEVEKHLPNIPSAEEVKNNGINVTELQTKQMEKIEELTLYMIQMNKRLNELEKENKELKNKVEKLEKK